MALARRLAVVSPDVRGMTLVYGLQHALVDACCAALLAHQRALGVLEIGTLYILYLAYNALAFGLQFFFHDISHSFVQFTFGKTFIKLMRVD